MGWINVGKPLAAWANVVKSKEAMAGSSPDNLVCPSPYGNPGGRDHRHKVKGNARQYTWRAGNIDCTRHQSVTGICRHSGRQAAMDRAKSPAIQSLAPQTVRHGTLRDNCTRSTDAFMKNSHAGVFRAATQRTDPTVLGKSSRRNAKSVRVNTLISASGWICWSAHCE